MEGVLTGLASKNSQQLNWRTSIVDLMKLLDLDSGLNARKELANELHYTGGDMNDSASVNIWLHKLMLFNIGDAEMTVGELTLHGCYLGSNVSYNVRKMVENGYLAQQRLLHDRRSIHVSLTERGIKLRDRLISMHQRHAAMLSRAALSADDLQGAGAALRQSERFWFRGSDLVQRQQFAV